MKASISRRDRSAFRKKGSQRALLAKWPSLAVMVAHCNELRMKIVVQGDFPLQISVKQFLDGIVVFQLLGYQPMPFQDSFRVRVTTKMGLPAA